MKLRRYVRFTTDGKIEHSSDPDKGFTRVTKRVKVPAELKDARVVIAQQGLGAGDVLDMQGELRTIGGTSD
jgi:hypothetical protein